jgi:hypothetical protein
MILSITTCKQFLYNKKVIMKRVISSAVAILIVFAVHSQNNNEQQLQDVVARLSKASTAKDFIQLAKDFEKLATSQNGKWLSYYYAAYCNAKIGWLYQDQGESIEPYADKAETQINTALLYLDTAAQKKELSEVYCVMSMANRARAFINPVTYGPKFGTAAFQFLQKARNANPDNPRALYLDGWEKFSAPKMWGGDKKKAKELLETALKQLNAENAPGNYPHWGKNDIEGLLKKLK